MIFFTLQFNFKLLTGTSSPTTSHHHALTHARLSLPDQNPNPAPAEDAISGLNDTAAKYTNTKSSYYLAYGEISQLFLFYCCRTVQSYRVPLRRFPVTKWSCCVAVTRESRVTRTRATWMQPSSPCSLLQGTVTIHTTTPED